MSTSYLLAFFYPKRVEDYPNGQYWDREKIGIEPSPMRDANNNWHYIVSPFWLHEMREQRREIPEFRAVAGCDLTIVPKFLRLR